MSVLAVLSLVSKDALEGTKRRAAPHWAQVQLWSCVVAALVQAPTWALGGGVGRVAAALGGARGAAFARLIAVNGVCYYAEQVMQFQAIKTYAPLTYSVVDTLRRLTIVVITGYFLRNEAFTATKCVGVLVVCAGAVYYNYAKESAAKKALAAPAYSAESPRRSPRLKKAQ